MKITFRKHFHSDHYYAIKRDHALNFDEDEIACLKIALFKSFDKDKIVIIIAKCFGPSIGSYCVDIKFKREEDENFFLILSNDGIEI